MSEPYRVEAARMGVRDYWLVEGETDGGRFAVPDGNLDVSVVRARLSGVDFSDLRFASLLAHDSVFEGCTFARTAFGRTLLGATGYGGERWDGQSWPETVYRDCVFTRTQFPVNAYFGNARFERCVFDRARLRGLTSTHEAQFVDCVFQGKIQTTTFRGTPTQHLAALGRSGNAFTGNDFSRADLSGVAFRQIDLRAQRFPGLPGYALLDRIEQRVSTVLAGAVEWTGDEIRSEVTWRLRHQARASAEDNDGYALVSRDWIGGRKVPPGVRDQLFAMLVACQPPPSPR